MKAKLTTLTLLLTASSLSFAEITENTDTSNEEFNPQDLTKVYTQAALLVGGNADLKAVSMVSGKFSESQSFAFLGDFTFGKEEDDKFGFNYKDGRAQYFHVLNTGFTPLPSAGFSVDYINKQGAVETDLLAFGTLTSINPAYTPGFMVFPQAAYMTGEMRTKHFDYKDDVDGYSVALAATTSLSDNGAFILFWPEYQNFSGDYIEVENYNMKMQLNAPISQNKRLWINTRLDVGKSKTSLLGESISTNDTEVYMGLRYFF